MTEAIKRQLVDAALRATDSAYAPYSGCVVGAALRCSDGTVFTGSNIENASFGATVCAERTALFTAVHSGQRSFSCIAVAGKKNGVLSPFYPCGICLQTLSEFCGGDMPVFVATSYDAWTETTLGALLSHSFSLGEK